MTVFENNSGFDFSFWESDEQLKCILNAMPNPVIELDAQGVIRNWNQAAEEYFGWSCEEVTGHSLTALILAEEEQESTDFTKALQQLSKPDSDQNTRSMEVKALTREKRSFPVNLKIVNNRFDQTVLFNVFVQELSDRKELERLATQEQLEKELAQQISLISSAADIFREALKICVDYMCQKFGWSVGHAWVLNDSGDRLISSNICHVYDHEEMQFDEYFELVKQKQHGKGEGLPGQVWETGKLLWMGNSHESPDDHISLDNPLQINSAMSFPIYSWGELKAVVELLSVKKVAPDENLTKIAQGVSKNISHMIDRVEWQKEQMRLAAIVESSSEAIIGMSPDGIITSWNKGAEQIYGWKSEEVTGHTIKVILPDDISEEEPQILTAIQSGEQLKQFQTRRKRKDKVVIDVSLTVSPILGSDGRVIGSSKIARDITSQRIREDEICKARDVAESAHRAQNEFVATVSHELRTPMNAILGMLDLALQEDLPEHTFDYLKTAKESANNLLMLVNEILDFSHLESGHFELEPVDFNLREMIDESIKSLSPRAYEKGLELACQIKHDVPVRIIGDPVRIRQILFNLIGNALKFTEQGEVVLGVSLAALESGKADRSQSLQENNRLLFSVSDTGIGISEEDQKRIFAPFAQADSSTTRHYSGTGLGLGICKELISQMQGKIWLESEPGQGSVFYFEIPYVMTESDKQTPEWKFPQIKHEEFDGLPVLVVDDNQTNLDILQEQLSSWKMIPTCVSSAEQGIDFLNAARSRNEKIGLLIVDALMPETDGFMFLEQVKAEEFQAIPSIMMLSATDHQIFNDRCETLQVTALLEKPIRQASLLDALITALKGTQTRQESIDPITKVAWPLNILVTEDTPANQKVISSILKKRGHQIVLANNGREAIECLLADKADFDVVLMDIQMPTMDGFQATTLIREMDNQKIRQIPIIAMTAFAMREDRQKCLDAGMNDYISKPLDAARLIRKIEQHAPQDFSPQNSEQDSFEKNEDSQAETPVVNPLATSAVCNLEIAANRLGNDSDLLHEMINLFQEDAPVLLQEICRCHSQGHWQQLTRASHSLKGLAANFEAREVVRWAREVEEISSQNQKTPQLESAITELGNHLQLLLQFLSAHAAHHSDSE